MNQQEALKYMMFDRVPVDPSKKYGKYPIARCVTAWNVAMQLADGDESRIDQEVLDEIMDAVDKGDNILEFFTSGRYEADGFMKNKGSEDSSGP